ncbi:MAG: OmpW family protein [Rickettsiales bacterium]|jgi:outer membrane protein|nr:OmpW family protein [Rickettsiales bacterium]
MRILKNLVIFCGFAISSKVFASESASVPKQNDYYANYYEDTESTLLFKIRGFYAATNAKMSNLPAPTIAGASKPGKLAQQGYGFDTAMTIFVTENIAAEVSLGLGFYKGKSSTLLGAVDAYGSGGTGLGKRNQIFMVPVTLSAQYHAAPYGGLRPYVGAGLNGTYMHTRSKAIKVDSGFGPVLQAGVDFISKDDTLFTVDIRQYLLKTKVKFKKGFLATDGISSKVNWNPLVISAGFGFKF